MIPTITVFTPTYNRQYLLHRCYESLKRQTSHDFMWLIIDDGSTDGTASQVHEWQKEDNGFEIKYIFKENGGMHTAHNTAYQNITTELNMCVDSDDYLTDDAIEKIVTFWRSHYDESVAGIIALNSDKKGEIIGSTIQEGVDRATTIEIYTKYKTTGDKKFIYRTDIITSVEPYPEYPGEKLVPLDYKYILIAQKHPMLILNETVCIVEYQPDGSSNTIFQQYKVSPRGFSAVRILVMQLPGSMRTKLKAIIHFVSCCVFAKDIRLFLSSPRMLATIFAIPFGLALNIYIRLRISLSNLKK